MGNNYPVSVLPLPVTPANTNLVSNVINYPMVPPNISRCQTLASSENHFVLNAKQQSKEKKYYTLLPSMTDSQLIENDMKYKLNKCAFDFPIKNDTTPTKNAKTTPSINNKPPITTTMIATPSDYTTIPAPPISPSGTSVSVYNSGSESSSSATSDSKVHSNKRRHTIKLASPSLKKAQEINTDDVARIEQRRRHVCKVCSKGFTTSGHLARHNRIHTGEKNHFCPFDGCNQRFSRHDNCIQHYRTHLRKKTST